MTVDVHPTILIVDDNPNNLRVLEGILRGAGYEVRPALNGATALRAAAIAKPDLVLLDIRMPTMDGFEVCTRLKADPATVDIPVIFVSALQEVDDKVQAFKAGGVDYIPKPFDAEEVLTRVRTHVELGRARLALARSNERLEEQVAVRTRELSESNARLQQAMREEHALRELLALSHRHFADPDYPERALDSLAGELGWSPPAVAGAIFTYSGGRGGSLTLAASRGYAPALVQRLAGLDLSGLGGTVLQPGAMPAERSPCRDIAALLDDSGRSACCCLPLVSGAQLLGLLVLTGTAPPSGQQGFIVQVAEVLAMGIARRQADEQLAWQAYHDELTALPNRRLLEEELAREMHIADSRGNCCGVLLIDLDQFKLLNDALGHGLGDLFLQQVARRIKNTVRASDQPFRWGGDEFIVLMPGIGANADEAGAHAHDAAANIAASLAAPIEAGGQAAHINASMGIALYPGDGATVQELLMHVELAMHKAKQAGRNTVHFFRPEMQGDAERRLQLDKEMRAALQEEQFLLHYQPQVDHTGRLSGAESLVRWQHPRRGLVAPGEFIPVAEESGLIQPIGEWVLERACRQLRRWQDDPAYAGLVLSVNVSPKQFHQADFVARVRQVLEATGAAPTALELEVTESLLLADIDGAVAKMDRLRELGIRFSVDDFGTGYSSLAYLKRLPVDQLKIDRSFVRGVHVDGRNASIVRTIISLAQNLGMRTIAEGVEEVAEVEFLREAGCEYFQGFYFGRPLPMEEFDRFWCG